MMTSRSIDIASGQPLAAEQRGPLSSGLAMHQLVRGLDSAVAQALVIEPMVAANESAVPKARHELVSDCALLYAWRAGDRTAGERLVARHTPALHRYFRRRVAHEENDLVQQTLLACVEARDKAPAGVAFRAYLFGIARNTLLLYLRRHEVRRRKEPLLHHDERASASPADDAIARERGERLVRELGRLPLDLQRTTRLFYWGEHKLSDISRELDVPAGTVKSRMHSAKRMLRTRLAVGG